MEEEKIFDSFLSSVLQKLAVACSGDQDEMPHLVASHLGLHCLLLTESVFSSLEIVFYAPNFEKVEGLTLKKLRGYIGTAASNHDLLKNASMQIR